MYNQGPLNIFNIKMDSQRESLIIYGKSLKLSESDARYSN